MDDQPAEGAAAGAAPHRLDRILDRLKRRNPALVFRMGHPRVGQFVDLVEFFGGQHLRRRFDHDDPVAVTLEQFAAVSR